MATPQQIYRRTYYLKHREKAIEYSKERSKLTEVKEKHKVYLRKWWAKNPEKTRGYRERKPPLSVRWGYYRVNARKRGLAWDLKRSEAEALFCGDCHYCGQAAEPTNGIDRKANGDGYNTTNCVSCCAICNRAKRDLPYDDFVSYLQRVARKLTN